MTMKCQAEMELKTGLLIMRRSSWSQNVYKSLKMKMIKNKLNLRNRSRLKYQKFPSLVKFQYAIVDPYRPDKY